MGVRALELFSCEPRQPQRGYRTDLSHWRGQSCVETLTVAAWYRVHNEPPDIQHASVVVNVEERDLMKVLP